MSLKMDFVRNFKWAKFKWWTKLETSNEPISNLRDPSSNQISANKVSRMNQVQKEQGDIDYEFYIGLSSHLVLKLSSAEPNPWIRVPSRQW